MKGERFKGIILLVWCCCAMLMLLQSITEEDWSFLVHHTMKNMTTTVYSNLHPSHSSKARDKIKIDFQSSSRLVPTRKSTSRAALSSDPQARYRRHGEIAQRTGSLRLTWPVYLCNTNMYVYVFKR